MESLIIIILFIMISSLSSGKKRRRTSNQQQRPNANPQPRQSMRDLAQQTLQTFGEALVGEPHQQTRSRSTRRTNNRPVAQAQREQECGYCTGEVAVESSLVHHTEAAAAPKDVDRPCVDVGALQKQWGLSDMQNAMLWQEILDKPLALRRRAR